MMKLVFFYVCGTSVMLAHVFSSVYGMSDIQGQRTIWLKKMVKYLSVTY